MKYIAYYRVSTKVQGSSGLGLEAQRTSVMRYINGEGIFMEFMEVESGKNDDRPKLSEAISACAEHGATLLIAKLDRLSRNASFTFSLMDSKVKFIAVDMPKANELTIGILAVLAQEEAKKISDRTSSALSEIKSAISRDGFYVARSGRSIKSLGSPSNLTSLGRDRSAKVRRSAAIGDRNNKMAYAFICQCGDMSYSKIAEGLNAGGFVTSSGSIYRAMTVKRIKELYDV